jgi:CRISPR-associated protein Cas6
MIVQPSRTEEGHEPVVDVSFPLLLTSAPRDHGYLLYSAISRVVPGLHEARWLGVHPLSGRPIDDETLDLGDGAHLRLRLPADKIPAVLVLAGAALNVNGKSATIGAPTIYTLSPAASLDARMVAIKLTNAPVHANPTFGRHTLDLDAFRKRYAQEIERQLAAIEIRKPFEIRGKRSLTVAGRRVLGYAVRVTSLSREESLRLLTRGIGGKRRMGCGVFRPTRAALYDPLRGAQCQGT